MTRAVDPFCCGPSVPLRRFGSEGGAQDGRWAVHAATVWSVYLLEIFPITNE
jgi:hypothetical protein